MSFGDKEHMQTGWRRGDRNMVFFHKWCSEGRRRNKIGRLKKEDGGWVEEEVEKQKFISNNFVQLFRAGAMGTHSNSSKLCRPKSPRR